MKGSKRFTVSESAPEPDVNDAAFRNKRIMSGSCIDVHRAEPSSQQQSTVTLDPQRAESSLQHVRALNTQFASWVQEQLKNHPDELWEDGVRDYLAHASNIMEKFSDVVNWLKANSVKGGTATETLTAGKKSAPEIKNDSESKLFQGKTVFVPPSSASTNSSFTASWRPAVFSNNQSSGGVFSISQSSGGALPNSQSSGGVFSASQSSGGGFSSGQSSGGVFSNSQSTGFLSNSQTSGLFSSSPSTGLFSKSQSSGFFSNNPSSAGSSSNQTPMLQSSQSFGLSFTNQNSGLFSNSHSSALSSSSQNSGLFSFSNNQSTGTNNFSLGGQNSTPANHSASDDIDDETELEQPSSPSVKKSEEKGITVVHEVKCKLYVKSSDASDKDTWKDKGMGQLSIKCKEDVSKGTKESKPTIVVRNDAGRVVLNALLYPGIKTNLQKNSLVAIFHTTGDDGGNNDSVVARTFLIRMKTEEDRNKLAAAIKEYSPES